MNKILFGSVSLLLGIVLCAASGSSVPVNNAATHTAYVADNQATAAWRSALTTADNVDLLHADITSLGTFKVGKKTTLSISARFSVASRSCKATVVYYYTGTDPSGATVTDKILGIRQTGTMAGTTHLDVNAKYLADTELMDTYGATHCRVLLFTAPASGNVDFHVGSY